MTGPRITIRLDLAETDAEPRLGRIGPGKIALLEEVLSQGSISAAARAKGLSYRRAWRMIDEMNRLSLTLFGLVNRGLHESVL